MSLGPFILGGDHACVLKNSSGSILPSVCCLHHSIFSLIELTAASHVASHSLFGVCLCMCVFVCDCIHRGTSLFPQLENPFPDNCSSVNVLSRCAL